MDDTTHFGRPERDGALEAVRGLAALAVVFYHGLMVFAPEHCGYYLDLVTPGSLSRRPWFGLVNGSAAVTVFFVLSGYVLTRGVFLTRDPGRAGVGMLKRYPRLVVPVTCAVLFSWCLFAVGAYDIADAARISGSPWLASFGDASGWPFPATLSAAFAEGTYGALLFGGHDFVPPLWTMHAELLGSLFVLAAAGAVVAKGAARTSAWAILSLGALATMATGAALAFAAGAGLGHVLARSRARLPFAAGVAGLVAGVLCMGYTDGTSVPVGLAWLLPAGLDAGMDKTLVHVAGGVLLVLSAQTCEGTGAFLSKAPFRVLGGLSFPLYLVHVPVMFSLGCAAYVHLSGILPREGAALGATLASLAASVPLAAAAAPLDKRWVAFLDRRGKALRAALRDRRREVGMPA